MQQPAPLERHTLHYSDGRHLYVYGSLRGPMQPMGIAVSPRDDDDGAALHQRRDLLTDDWIAISPARNRRPQTGAEGTETHGEAQACPLCPGGPEVPFSYQAAVFDNRYPSFLASPPGPSADELVAPSLGRCEVVLYTEKHDDSLAALSPQQMATVVAVWCDRSAELWATFERGFVLIFENRGEEVGATLSHPHGQIYAFDRIPPGIIRKLGVLADHRDRHRTCLTCDVIARDDAATERMVQSSESFTVGVPFAPRWPFEVHVRARRHGVHRLSDLRGAEKTHLAAALQEIVRRYNSLFRFELPYMLVAQEAPADPEGVPWDDWHLAFQFLPPHRSATQLKVRASVETATGLFINDTLPEASAAALRATDTTTNAWDDVQVPLVTAAL